MFGRNLLIVFVFLTSCYFAYGDHTANQKHYCWECLMTNGSKCSQQFSTKVRCPDLDKFTIPFYCFERDYEVNGVLNSERGCIRKDFYEAGWLCFENLAKCEKKICTEHMCNSATVQKATFIVFFCLLYSTLKMLFL